MKNIFIINGHEIYPFSEGKLNATLVDMAKTNLAEKGYEVKITTMQDDYDVEEELAKHQWADAILLQTPVNWMGVTWSFKRYLDYIYSAGLGGQLCNGDGRTRKDPSKQYGTGGTLPDTKYMLSLTFNAPEEAFNDPNQWFFEGKSADDLFWPMHLNFKFFAMQPMETFVCYDVMKNPNLENDFIRFRAHLDRHFPAL
ncbi:NAD(P)H-dependent oxidoreductase [Roseofilum casamattae]|uniref:NAD(P)H-dependent oxidoreductase n=1 Tax=Roseofilum casamattae BLCC-M143 TaxID=3022442 RepID=A0ABT7BZP6_9CYAN|nr:NAD(P)H-dependent oxidoreductase [Roseofilum casamattae]MDJ1184662.1 NAD(P)H-dependent oxidoreductase [Roseofilum casamattae BLCC-M143]